MTIKTKIQVSTDHKQEPCSKDHKIYIAYQEVQVWWWKEWVTFDRFDLEECNSWRLGEGLSQAEIGGRSKEKVEDFLDWFHLEKNYVGDYEVGEYYYPDETEEGEYR